MAVLAAVTVLLLAIVHPNCVWAAYDFSKPWSYTRHGETTRFFGEEPLDFDQVPNVSMDGFFHTSDTYKLELPLDPIDNKTYCVAISGFDVDQWLDDAIDEDGVVDWASFFQVAVVLRDRPSYTVEMQPTLGMYKAERDRVLFIPRFPFMKKVLYEVKFLANPASFMSNEGYPHFFIEEFGLNDRPRSASGDTLLQQSPKVMEIYPAVTRLPENLLKFYIQFSEPMSSGDVYKYIHLLDDSANEVNLPFLELNQELWDREFKRLTLFIDPGRIKREVKPLEDIGPVFEAGKSYSLVIDGEWENADGYPLSHRYEKKFEIVDAVREPIDPQKWDIILPDSWRPNLIVRFDRPLDHALANRAFAVLGSQQIIDGVGEYSDAGNSWSFTPADPLPPGAYQLRIEAVLEDLAGNNIGKAFETQLYGDTPVSPDNEFHTLDFTIPEPNPATSPKP